MSKPNENSITARLSLAVYAEISKRGVFGETVDDVLRRVFELPENDDVRPGHRARENSKKHDGRLRS